MSMFVWYLTLLSVPIARLSFILTCDIWGDQVKCSTKRTPRYFTEIVGISIFPTQRVLFFLHLEKVYLHLTVLRAFSDHDSFSLLIFPVNCLRELCWYHLQSDMLWSILDMSRNHWCRWGLIMDLGKTLEALRTLLLWLLRLG